MTRKKALQLYKELKADCPKLLLVGSTLRNKEDDIRNLDLIWVGKIFPMHLLPVGEMETLPKVAGSDMLRFNYQGEQVDIYRADKEKLGAMILHLTGPKEYGIYLRMIAKRKGLKLNQYGLFKEDKLIASKTEQDIIEALDKKYLEPQDRNRFRSIKM